MHIMGDHLLFDGATCRFGSVDADVHFVSSTFLLCETPEHALGTVALEVRILVPQAVC